MTSKELQATKIVAGWNSVFLTKSTKNGVMSEVRREITENEILGLIDWYASKYFEQDNCNEFTITGGDGVARLLIKKL